MSDGSIPSLAAAHLRLGRAAVGIYVAAAALALSVSVAFLLTERTHDERELRKQVLLEADDRAHALESHLDLLTRELQRLGLRSEVDLLDQNLEPERSLLELSHGSSTFFNLGVAILGVDGAVAWAEPKRFLPLGKSFTGERWFADFRATLGLSIVAIDPERPEDAALYVVAPVVRAGQYQGALLGGIDLASSHELSIADHTIGGAHTVVATSDGRVVFPARPPAFAHGADWQRLFTSGVDRGLLSTLEVDHQPQVVAAAPLEGTDLRLLLLVDESTLFRESTARLRTRLLIGVALAVFPLLALIALLRQSLRTFRRGEEQAMREERLHRVGEAANLIAHEVKNSLNGIRMAAELAHSGDGPSGGRSRRALTELRGEIERLSNFTGDLMTFSKGIKPRLVRLELNELSEKVLGLFEARAQEASVDLQLERAATPIWISGDPQLLRVAISNVLDNALGALATRAETPAPPYIRLSVAEASEGASIVVSDNGDGVAPAMQERLFEPFQSGKPSGVGIGLALGRRIAVAHGGNLRYEPTRPGAHFRLTLPRESA